MDDGLKQRLIGALVLAAVAVIFLPSLFTDNRQRRVDSETRIPPAPAMKAVELKAPVRPANIPPAKSAETMYRLVDEPAVSDKEEAPALDSEGIPHAWVIQVASYTTLERANQLRDQLIDKGYKAYSRKVETDKGPAVRVFVGPKLDKQQAVSIKNELDKSFKVSAMVLRFRP